MPRTRTSGKPPTKESGTDWMPAPWNEMQVEKAVAEFDRLNAMVNRTREAWIQKVEQVEAERDALRYAIEHVVIASPHVADTVKHYLRAALERPS